MTQRTHDSDSGPISHLVALTGNGALLLSLIALTTHWGLDSAHYHPSPNRKPRAGTNRRSQVEEKKDSDWPAAVNVSYVKV